MTPFVLAFLSLALVLGVYGFVGLPFGSRGRRAAVSIGFAVVLAGLFFGYSDMLGRPKSTRLELLHRPVEGQIQDRGDALEPFAPEGKLRVEHVARKPLPFLWYDFVEQYNDGIEPDRAKSFYCGDAAGRIAGRPHDQGADRGRL